MLNIREHIRTGRGILTMLIVLFSLSPCPVKKTVLGSVDIAYSVPLNKAKATVSSLTGCNAFIASKTTVSKPELKQVTAGFSDNLTLNNWPQPFTNSLFSDYSGYLAGSTPPKYILFKRLKFHLV